MSYWIYKQFGRVIGEKEIHATINKYITPWYFKPYYNFIIFIEKSKRWLKAEKRLPGDNPFKGCFLEIIFGVIFGLIIFFIIYFIKTIINII